MQFANSHSRGGSRSAPLQRQAEVVRKGNTLLRHRGCILPRHLLLHGGLTRTASMTAAGVEADAINAAVEAAGRGAGEVDVRLERDALRLRDAVVGLAVRAHRPLVHAQVRGRALPAAVVAAARPPRDRRGTLLRALADRAAEHGAWVRVRRRHR